MKIDTTTITTADGCTYRLAGFDGRIEHVTVPWGGTVSSQGLHKDEQGFISSILVVPFTQVLTQDLGTLTFTYGGQLRYATPVIASMNRYHRLVSLQGLINRLRVVVDPAAAKSDFADDGFHNGIVEPIHIRERLRCELSHQAPDGVDSLDPLTVEFQWLVATRRISPLWENPQVMP
jgi:hypothetical protein